MSERQTGASTMLVAVAAGAIGAGLALLLAPRSGSETREKLHKTADELKYRAHDNMESAKDAIGESIEKASDMQRKVASAIKTRKTELKQDLDDTIDSTRTQNTQSLNQWEEEK
jgi:gas vesicle protein